MNSSMRFGENNLDEINNRFQKHFYFYGDIYSHVFFQVIVILLYCDITDILIKHTHTLSLSPSLNYLLYIYLHTRT